VRPFSLRAAIHFQSVFLIEVSAQKLGAAEAKLEGDTHHLRQISRSPLSDPFHAPGHGGRCLSVLKLTLREGRTAEFWEFRGGEAKDLRRRVVLCRESGDILKEDKLSALKQPPAGPDAARPVVPTESASLLDVFCLTDPAAEVGLEFAGQLEPGRRGDPKTVQDRR